MGKFTRSAVIGGALGLAALGLAATASAEVVDGPYHIVVTNGGGFVADGAKDTAFLSSCGVDCTSVVTPGWSADLRLQGTTYTGVTTAGLVLSFDQNSLAGSMVKNGSETVLIQLNRV